VSFRPTDENLCYNSNSTASGPCPDTFHNWAFYDRGVVYFIRSGLDGPIKIGWSSSYDGALQRRDSMQVGNPELLYILAVQAVANQGVEADLHKRFAESRIRGEWFEPTDELLALIPKGAALEPPEHSHNSALRVWQGVGGERPGRWRTVGKQSDVTVRHVDPATLRD
jgi:hypothetical protein